MAHFSELDDNNIVLRTVVISNQDIKDPNGDESEQIGIGVCRSIFGATGRWIQTSYNGSFRRQYAQPGFTYNETFDAFIEPAPFPSWTLDEEGYWQPPVPKPTDGGDYSWDEENQTWNPVYELWPDLPANQ